MSEAIDKLLARAAREVEEGLLPAAQIAVARNGEVVLLETFGDAQDDSLFCMFSATKAITASAAWLLVENGTLDLAAPVASLLPEFATNGKDAVRVEQLFTHTAGFPHAPFRPHDWLDAERRAARYAQWRLSWTPGERYEYHPTASMWVIAELIERVSGLRFTDFVRSRVLDPLGLGGLWVGGLNDAAQARAVDICFVGDPLTAADYEQLGMPVPPETEVNEDTILRFNDPEVRSIGVPGGGGFANAADLALFYQALLHGELNGGSVWRGETLAAAREVRSGNLRDPYLGHLANRGLGIVIAGDEQRSFRGFGKTNSPLAFGHNGAGGQLAWVDPESGLSLAYLTNAHDRNELREARRGVAISSLAALC